MKAPPGGGGAIGKATTGTAQTSRSAEPGQAQRCTGCGAAGHPSVIVYDREAPPGVVLVPVFGWHPDGRPAKPTATSADWPADRPCVELDALQPNVLRDMVRNCIEARVDQDQLEYLRRIELHERDQLAVFGKQIAGVAP